MAANYPEVSGDAGDYAADWKTRLHGCLHSITSTGKVAVFQYSRQYVNPGLTVGDDLPIGLPLTERDAVALKGYCRQAPFGRRDETVVDASVRKTWELDHTQFKLANPQWQHFLEKLVQNAEKELGLAHVVANPYKLLLYEEGSFFRPHKDSEKEPGMVATLVICLPSKHTGGDVHVTFRGKNQVLSTDSGSEFDLSALAWYSDVTHEVKPVTSGYRLALTYNVVAKGDGTPPTQKLTTQLDGLHSALSQWPAHLPRLFYTLDHKYSEASISMKHLKGRDLAVGESLRDIARELDIMLFLVNMSRTEDDYDDFYDDDLYDASKGSGTMSVYSCDGNSVSRYMSYLRSDGDILDPEAFWDRDADEYDEGEFTGNAHQPAAYTYRDSAIMMVPMTRLSHFLAGIDGDIKNLVAEVTSEIFRKPPTGQVRSAVIAFMESVLRHPSPYHVYIALPEVAEAAVALGLPALYQATVKESARTATRLTGGSAESKVDRLLGISRRMVLKIILLAIEEYKRNGGAPIKWSDWLVDVARSVPSLSAFDRVVALMCKKLNSAKDTSLRDWRRETFESWVDWRDSISHEDMDYITKVVISRQVSSGQNNSSLTDNHLLPALLRKGPSLIPSFLRILLCRPIGPRHPDTKAALQYLIPSSLSSIGLTSNDLQSLAMSPGPNRFATEPPRLLFLSAIHECARHSLASELDGLLETATTLLRDREQPNSPIKDVSRHHLSKLTGALLERVASPLGEHNTPPTPAIRALFETGLAAVHVPRPIAPSEAAGWRFHRRGCGSGTCAPCTEVDAFLASDTQREITIFPGSLWSHFRPRLKRIERGIEFERTVHSNETMVTVKKTVRETGSSHDVHAVRMNQWRQTLTPLRGEYFKVVLGEEDYRRFVDPGPAQSDGEGRVTSDALATSQS